MHKAYSQERALRKEKDHHWDNLLDNPYQPSPVPYSSRLFKVISSSPPSLPLESQDRERSREYRACRLRIGRGGRRLLDRRVLGTHPTPSQTTTRGVPTMKVVGNWRNDGGLMTTMSQLLV
ncbi:hypothetical protein PHLCEN_2v10500 [Hermanssonia centrifuga]|uniref:Uncharacterized protein n=1 Tax=Hermanssonia centrifuga TaxID=98765 RepID=A0A2R6NMH0_9APHY|nr:hypothetical protein PHLCEN_2v10500 [Hermanssonia centrifuga]